MTNRAFTKIYASTIAPDPKMNIIWMDLSENPYGKILKYWNGQTWLKYEGIIPSSVDLAGVPTTNTASAGTNTRQLATTAFVTTAVSGKANSANPLFTGVTKLIATSYASKAEADLDELLLSGSVYKITDTGALMMKL
jgi:hypothetical protein